MRTIDEIEQLERKLIFSSGAPSVSNKYYGGGIYLLELKKFKWTYSKKIDGNCYVILKYKSNYISIDQSIGIFEFDQNFKITRSKKLPFLADHMVLLIPQNMKNFIFVAHIKMRF